MEFTGDNEQSDHPLRALYCATAVQELSKQLLNKQGVQLELASAIIQFEQHPSPSQLLNERAYHDNFAELHTLLGHSGAGDTVMKTATREHTSMGEVHLSPITPNNTLFKVDKLHDQGDELVTQQVALLARQL